jgi:hypothetical protein
LRAPLLCISALHQKNTWMHFIRHTWALDWALDFRDLEFPQSKAGECGPGAWFCAPARALQHRRPWTSCAIRGAKTRTIGSFKSNQCAPRPVFSRVCRHVTSKQHFRSIFFAPRSWWSCSATARGSPAARAGDTGAHPTPALDFFRAISAGGCLLVSTVTPCGAKPNSQTPLGSVVLPLLKIAM